MAHSRVERFPLARQWLAGRGYALVWLLLLAAAGCAVESVIPADQLMPPGAKEVMAPRDLVDKMVGTASLGQFWVRAGKLEGGWPKVVEHVEKTLDAQGYHEVEYNYGDLRSQFKQQHLMLEDYVRCYRSPHDTILIFVANIAFLREHHIQVEGLADFVIFGGFDPRHSETQSPGANASSARG
jgi:hypothetical protein